MLFEVQCLVNNWALNIAAALLILTAIFFILFPTLWFN